MSIYFVVCHNISAHKRGTELTQKEILFISVINQENSTWLVSIAYSAIFFRGGHKAVSDKKTCNSDF